jgi:hypothetical protein
MSEAGRGEIFIITPKYSNCEYQAGKLQAKLKMLFFSYSSWRTVPGLKLGAMLLIPTTKMRSTIFLDMI